MPTLLLAFFCFFLLWCGTHTRKHTRPFLYTGRSVYLPFAPDFLLSVRVVRKSPPAPPRGGPVPPRRRALCSGLRGSLPPALRPDERVSSVLAGVHCGPGAGPGRGGCGRSPEGRGRGSSRRPRRCHRHLIASSRDAPAPAVRWELLAGGVRGTRVSACQLARWDPDRGE